MQASPEDGAVGEIAPCALCGQMGPVGRVIPIFTALRHATTQKTGFKEYTTTTFTGAVREHRQKVCEECVATARGKGRTLVIAAALLVAVGIPYLMASNTRGFWIAAAVFAVIFVAGNIYETFVDVEQRAKRATTGARTKLFGDKSGGDGLIAFTASEYKSFAKKNRR